jgi:hypothetical protein
MLLSSLLLIPIFGVLVILVNKDTNLPWLEWTLHNAPKPHGFATKTLHSEMSLSEIITDLNTLLPQLADFINQFDKTVSQNGINVMTDSLGNMSIDVPQNISNDSANQISTRIGIIDRLITTRGQEINSLLQKGIVLENKLKSDNPDYVPQLLEKIQEFKRLNCSYRH